MDKEHYRTNFEVLTRVECTTILVRPARINIQRIYGPEPYIQACPIAHGSHLVIYPTPPEAAIFEVSTAELEAFYADPTIIDPKQRTIQEVVPGTIVFSPFQKTFRLSEYIVHNGDSIWMQTNFINPNNVKEIADPHYGLLITIAAASAEAELDELAARLQKIDYARETAIQQYAQDHFSQWN